jgi:ABC-type multidrug transport system fused ATPase/permease subunit
MAFLKVILFIILFYYLARIILRFLFPLVFQHFVSQKMNDFSGNYTKNQKQSKSKEGEITIDNISNTRSKPRKYKGEYIDYEEIKE